MKPKIPDSIPFKYSGKEIILIEEVKNWFIQKMQYEKNMHKAYVLILEQCTEALQKNYKRENIGKQI